MKKLWLVAKLDHVLALCSKESHAFTENIFIVGINFHQCTIFPNMESHIPPIFLQIDFFWNKVLGIKYQYYIFHLWLLLRILQEEEIALFYQFNFSMFVYLLYLTFR